MDDIKVLTDADIESILGKAEGTPNVDPITFEEAVEVLGD